MPGEYSGVEHRLDTQTTRHDEEINFHGCETINTVVRIVARILLLSLLHTK